MCRRGTHKRRAIREEEIESMSQLMQERKTLFEAHDFAMMTFKDQQIVEKACREFWDQVHNHARRSANEEALKLVLTNWIQHRNYGEYRDWFYTQCKECIKAGNSNILSMLLEHYQTVGKRPYDNLNEALQICCEQNDPACLNVCLQYNAEESQFCSSLNACAVNKNETMFKLVAKRMKQQQVDENYFFISPELFKSILLWDNVEAMRTVALKETLQKKKEQQQQLVQNQMAAKPYKHKCGRQRQR